MNKGDLVRIRNIKAWRDEYDSRAIMPAPPIRWDGLEREVESLEWIISSNAIAFGREHICFPVKPGEGAGWTEEMRKVMWRNDGLFWYIPERFLVKTTTSSDPIDRTEYRKVIAELMKPNRRTM